METYYLESVDSTQLFLESALKNGRLKPPIAIWTLDQTGGIGSRANRWLGLKGNLALSFALPQSALSADLPPQSASLYFGFLFKECLSRLGSAAWMKWPNDLYLGDKKIGGVITKLFESVLVCGIGLNILPPSEEFGALEIACNLEALLADYLKNIRRGESWGAIFSRFAIEYEPNRRYEIHLEGRKMPLWNSTLNADGSITIGNERVFSKR
ncbi:MAG: biotin--[acetyl-CoA-carboxylase] ligase [Helicobacteraceae bacterium]|nr:biotin--[acetyl-CoA-carboxylase] ligase [Helicobacteraceae bacterium]